MSKSYEKVNYLLRLKKQIERKMIIETAQELSPIIDISSYHYFGLGSIYFADFILFHKNLNIKMMTSVENNKDDEQRCLFNKPFGFLNFQVFDAHRYLENKLNWSNKLFIWLDYDYVINQNIISDIELVSAKSKTYDMFFITVEASQPPNPSDFIKEYKIFLPSDTKEKTIIENYPLILHKIIKSSIENGLKNQSKQTKFLQLFNLIYKDTTKMYTFGGVFYRGEDDNPLINKVSKLTYISHDGHIVEINCPLLTPKEKLYLDSCVKNNNVCVDEKRISGLTPEDVNSYGRFYKYYPQFFESVY